MSSERIRTAVPAPGADPVYALLNRAHALLRNTTRDADWHDELDEWLRDYRADYQSRNRDRLTEAEAIIRRFHEACWDYDGDLPDEIEAAASEALAFLGDSFRPSGGAA